MITLAWIALGLAIAFNLVAIVSAIIETRKQEDKDEQRG